MFETGVDEMSWDDTVNGGFSFKQLIQIASRPVDLKTLWNFHFLSGVPIFIGELPNGRQLQVALCEFSGRVQEECQEPGSEGHPRHAPPAARHHGIAMGRALVAL